MSVNKELKAFDMLPTQLRNVLNYTHMNIDPRYILGMYKQQGLRDTLDYLDGIGLGGQMVGKEFEYNN